MSDAGGQPAAVRVYELRGADAALAVDWLHVHAAVDGVLEDGDAQVVWLAQPLPALPESMSVHVSERVVRPEDHHVTGLENDAAILVADDLLVRPPWVERPDAFDGIELVVPRGAAFGSGEHDSTKAALVVLHRGWTDADSVADVGTGSGILALYAHVRGAARIEACDIDGPSVAAARELLPAADVRLGGPDLLQPCAFVIANMTGTELGAALPDILSIWTRGRDLILSGMREHEVDGLVARVPAREVDRQTLGAFTSVRFRAG